MGRDRVGLIRGVVLVGAALELSVGRCRAAHGLLDVQPAVALPPRRAAHAAARRAVVRLSAHVARLRRRVVVGQGGRWGEEEEEEEPKP